jgi:hypothetical protein
MRNVLIAAAALVALAMPAEAAPKHVWFDVNYGSGTCDKSLMTPEEFYRSMAFSPMGKAMGVVVSPISPENVTKDDKGNIHVHVDATRNGDPVASDFFTLKADCADSGEAARL